MKTDLKLEGTKKEKKRIRKRKSKHSKKPIQFLGIQQQGNFIRAYTHLLTKAKEYYFKVVSN